MASIEVIDIIKNHDVIKITLGQTTEEYLHDAYKIGDELIISKPMSSGPTYPFLPIDFEDEIKFLNDSTRKISNIEEAIKRIEGISIESVDKGMQYVKERYSNCYPFLTKRIQEFRIISFKNPDYFFANYRIENITKALLLLDSDKLTNFLLEETDIILSSNPNVIIWDKIPFRGETPQGNYLRAMLKYSKNYKQTHKLLRNKMIQHIKLNHSKSIVYFSYALAFDNLNETEFKELSNEQKNYFALGIVYAAAWNKYWFRHEETKTLVKFALKLSSVDSLNKYIKKKFVIK